MASPASPHSPRPAAASTPAQSAPFQRVVANPTFEQPIRPTFPVVRRGGYDRAAVDSFFDSFDADSRRVATLQAELGALRSRLAENAEPTYAGLGGHAAAILRLAEEQAAAVIAAANRAAGESRQLASREASALRADAEKEAADIRTAQLHEIEERRSTVLSEAEQERSLARAEASDILAAVKRQADQWRLAAQQEANALRTAARREVEQARAVVEREATESRRQLAVDRERLTKEAVDRHGSAMAETHRLVAEAEMRAKAAEDRAADATATATKHREQAAAEADRSLSRSRHEAEQIVRAARSQAEQIVSNATANADRQTAAARAELEALEKRRDAIVAQLAQLRHVVTTFHGDDARPELPSQQPQQA
ncbi:MAG: hypothetical protein QOJ60_465 [Actinomycetota bacterium]|nr:hypothetical protein [Actinomycetota bacterium]